MAVDFETVIPEELRGLPPYQGKINWDALKLVCDRMIGSRLERQLAEKRLFKQVRTHGIGILLPRLRVSYCTARLYLGDFSDYWGWEFRGVFDQGESRTWAADLYWSETWMPKWGGGSVNRLLILGEQGVGDAVFFASIIPEAMIRCHEVIYECDERLFPILHRSLKGLKCRPERDFEDRRVDYGPIDAYIPAAELMRMFRRRKQDFPGKKYLKPNPDRLGEFDKYRGRTGISWKGRQGFTDPSHFGVIDPLSLQYNASDPMVEAPAIDLKDDLDGVITLCSVLEKVVTVPTTVHHLAGAVGCKVEIRLPENKGEVDNQIRWDTPPGKLIWYPDVTCNA